MNRWRWLISVLALLVSLGPWAPAARAATGTAIGVEPVVTGLTSPAAFAFRPDGSIFFGTLQTGVIRIYVAGTGVTHVFFRVTNIVAPGLLGLAVHPNFPNPPYVYAYATRKLGGKVYDQILRIQSRSGVGISPTTIFSIQANPNAYHYGGPMAFGPDGMLYAVVGDDHNPADSQNLDTPLGKILRMTPAGRAPGDNVLGHRLFVRGVRNSFGLNFDPDTGKLWETENGPECNDELNQFSGGENGGWGPQENCDGVSPDDTNNSGPSPRTLPLWWSETTIAPTGMVFCPAAGCGLTGSEGNMFFGDWNQDIVHEVTLTPDRLGVASVTDVIDWSDGIYSMQRNPTNGALYFSDQAGIYELVST